MEKYKKKGNKTNHDIYKDNSSAKCHVPWRRASQYINENNVFKWHECRFKRYFRSMEWD